MFPSFDKISEFAKTKWESATWLDSWLDRSSWCQRKGRTRARFPVAWPVTEAVLFLLPFPPPPPPLLPRIKNACRNLYPKRSICNLTSNKRNLLLFSWSDWFLLQEPIKNQAYSSVPQNQTNRKTDRRSQQAPAYGFWPFFRLINMQNGTLRAPHLAYYSTSLRSNLRKLPVFGKTVKRFRFSYSSTMQLQMALWIYCKLNLSNPSPLIARNGN